MDDSDSYFYEEDFDDPGLLSAVQEAEAAKRQRTDSLNTTLVHIQLPGAQQTGVPARPVISELPQTPASGRSHSSLIATGGAGRLRSEGRMAPSTASTSRENAALSLIPVLAPQWEHQAETPYVAQRGNVRNSQSFGQNARPPDTSGASLQQRGPPQLPSNQNPSSSLPPNATPPASPQQHSSWPANDARNPYYVTHPPAASRPSTPYQQPQTPQQVNQRMPLQQVSENQLNHPKAGALALVDRHEGRLQVAEAGGQENLAAVAPGKKKELWLDCPRASVFRSFQDEAMQILDPCDYQMLQGKRMIKKTGWRKLGMFFGVNYEIKDFRDDTDQNGDIVRSRFLVKAIMPNGRYCEATGSCDANEKRFSKPNNDIPATAETRAKTRAVQDLLGIGEWKSHQ